MTAKSVADSVAKKQPGHLHFWLTALKCSLTDIVSHRQVKIRYPKSMRLDINLAGRLAHAPHLHRILQACSWCPLFPDKYTQAENEKSHLLLR